MNNYLNICRISHKESKLGPYQHANQIEDLELKGYLEAEEPYNYERKWVKNLRDPKNKYGVTSYSLKRPGALEDPLLRHNLKIYNKKPFYKNFKFGFRDLDQLHSWFSSDDLNFLFEKGFIIEFLKIPKKNILEGDKQIIIIY